MDKNITLINKFISENNNLELLESRLNIFNPFRVLKIDEFEIKHSNFLAWLLNPRESHNFGDKILKKIIVNIISENHGKRHSIKLSDLYKMSFYDARVYREYNYTDLLVISKENRFILLIENKFNSKINEKQILRYLDKIKEEYPKYRIVPVLLNLPDSEECQDEKICNYNYGNVYDIIKFILELNKNNLNIKIRNFIEYYLNTLEVKMEKNTEIERLCKAIYNDHKEAIELINEYTGVDNSAAFKIFESQNPSLIVEWSTPKRMFFIPKEFKEIMPNNLTLKWKSEYPISFWFTPVNKYTKLAIILEVGPLKDDNLRKDLIEFLKKKGFKPGSSPRYSRIFRENKPYEKWDDPDRLSKKMNEMYNSKDAEKVKIKIISAIREFWSDYNPTHRKGGK